MGTTTKRRESAYDDVSATTNKQKNKSYHKLTQAQKVQGIVQDATSSTSKKRRKQTKDRRENEKRTMMQNTTALPSTIQIGDSMQESGNYRNRSNSVKSNSTSTSSKSHHCTVSTFTQSHEKSSGTQIERTMKTMEENYRRMEASYKAQIEQLQEQIKMMETSKKITTRKVAPAVSQQFQGYVKHIAKNHIYPRVKFIMNERTLDNWKPKNSIGYAFLSKFHEGTRQQQGYNDAENWSDEQIWENSKNIVYDMIRQKRGSVQTEIKKGFKGAYRLTFQQKNYHN